MCTIERFDVVYPDGRRVPRERLVPCSRGTRTRQCSNVEVRPIFEDELATVSDRDSTIGSHHHVSTLRGSEGSESRLSHKNNKPKQLAVSFKLWNPFKSKTARKSNAKTYLVRQRAGPREDRPAVIRPLPRAPTPPPVMPRRGRSPVIVPVSPHRGRRSTSPHPRRRPRPLSRSRSRSHERNRKPRRKRKEDQPPIVIYPTSSSEENETPSPPLVVRDHQRKSRSISPRSKYEAEKKLIRDTERRLYAERVAREEQEAQRRAARVAEFERLERERKRQERIGYEERRQIESAERARRRQQQEEFQRVQARRRQE